eukprot:TRINITY_DN2258_c0_g1_i4.p1 TRINITY_DN2258_c0_g1~~TRINITY_DN2258_c0_g1_i4.p1  ORF type:complete len:191 (+),score=32.18 TRINITY_DN2258_c0_g1_i4:97-669(+)
MKAQNDNRHQNNPSFWFRLRQYKKALRNSYANDMQSAFEKGVQSGITSEEVRDLAKRQWQDGHAHGVYYGLVRISSPIINTLPSPFIPAFVIKLLKEVRENLKKSVRTYQNLVKTFLQEGTFKVKSLGNSEIAVKEIFQITGTRKDKRSRSQDLENELAEIEKMRIRKKYKFIKPVDSDVKKGIGTRSPK